MPASRALCVLILAFGLIGCSGQAMPTVTAGPSTSAAPSPSSPATTAPNPTSAQPTATATPASTTTAGPTVAPGTLPFAQNELIGIAPDPTTVAVTDVNGDGAPDVLVCGETDPRIDILLNDGHGNFIPQQPVDAGGHPCFFITTGDLNGDGHPDAVLAGSDGTVEVMLGNRHGSFAAPTVYSVQGALAVAQTWTVALGDMNGDQNPDIVAAVYGAAGPSNSAPGQLAVLLNDGASGFKDPGFYIDKAAVGLALADFNTDGFLDAIAADFDSTARVFLGDGSGALTFTSESPIGGQGVVVATGDVDDDGAPDALTGNDATSTGAFLHGLGDGTFDASLNLDAGNTHAVQIADVDGDGNQDLLLGGYSEDFVRVYLGNGDGTFGGEMRIASTNGVRGFDVADFNGDGKLDIAVADAVTSVHILLQQ